MSYSVVISYVLQQFGKSLYRTACFGESYIWNKVLKQTILNVNFYQGYIVDLFKLPYITC